MAAAVLHAMPGDLSETVRGEFPPVATRPRGRAREARRLRRLRYWLRTVAQDLSSAKGIVRCGRRRTFAPGGQGTVEIRLNSETGAAYFAGVLLVLRAGLDAEVQRELLALVRRRWTDAITRPNPDGGKQYRPPSLEHGVTLTVSHEDDYLAKLGLADELAGAAVKRAAADHRTPLEILVGAARRDPRDRALWVEYARDMRGARKLTWGGALGTPAGRAAWGLAPDQPDLALAGAEERGPALVVAELEGKVWDTLVLGDVRLQLRLLRTPADLPPPEARDRIARALLWAAGDELPPF